MAFPSSDPLWIVELLKVIVMCIAGSVLLIRWSRSKRHYFTDTPFLFSLAFFFIAGGEAVDVIFDSGFAPMYTLTAFQFRASLLGCGLLAALFASILIWFIERRRLGYLLMGLFTVLFFFAAWLAPTQDLVRLWTMPFLLIMYVTFIGTFLLAWIMKRLPDVHGLVMSFGAGIAVFGQVFKTLFAVLGIAWAADLIDLFGLTILCLGLLIKPGYAKKL